MGRSTTPTRRSIEVGPEVCVCGRPTPPVPQELLDNLISHPAVPTARSTLERSTSDPLHSSVPCPNFLFPFLGDDGIFGSFSYSGGGTCLSD